MVPMPKGEELLCLAAEGPELNVSLIQALKVRRTNPPDPATTRPARALDVLVYQRQPQRNAL
jgi:hypothetical protein